MSDAEHPSDVEVTNDEYRQYRFHNDRARFLTIDISTGEVEVPIENINVPGFEFVWDATRVLYFPGEEEVSVEGRHDDEFVAMTVSPTGTRFGPEYDYHRTEYEEQDHRPTHGHVVWTAGDSR